MINMIHLILTRNNKFYSCILKKFCLFKNKHLYNKIRESKVIFIKHRGGSIC